MHSVLQTLWQDAKYTFGSDFSIDSKTFSVEEIIEKLLPFISESRLNKFDEVLDNRTHNFIPVMENLHDRGNISAAMRTAESFGFYQFCTIEQETKEKYKYSRRTAKGAQKWCAVSEYGSTTECLSRLKDLGYQVLTTHLSESAIAIQEVDFSKKTALVFGNEKVGVSAEALKASDANVHIPMHGFTQSFNISVAAALSFTHVYSDRCQRLGKNGDLTQMEKKYLLANYLIVGIQNSRRILSSL